jgi:hypothetical protein
MGYSPRKKDQSTMMSKKDFVELADYLRKPGMIPAVVDRVLEQHDNGKIERAQLTNVLVAELANELADFCKAQNGNFDRERWLGYISGSNGVNGGKVVSK